MRRAIVILFLLLVYVSFGKSQTLLQEANPVLKGVCDAGVLRFGGQYYLGGVGTYGDFYVSSDLVHWDKKIHVFDLDNEWTHGTGAKNNQIHADDIIYCNGLFHLLFSVNYWGSDRHLVHIVHATSPCVEGPYKEPCTDQWFENRIDPHVFRDEDGSLYLYMVKFTEGNTIWARRMNQDFSFAGEAVQQFSSQPGTWETMDNRVAEGPWVVKYRGRYYMMYNTNHTAPECGNYRLGVCEAADPLSFGPGGKYSHPVVGPNLPLCTPGQPNIVRGPNGWEWWLVYMANIGMERSQFIDRVHFVRDRLTVDGITGPETPGFHPLPSLPKYSGKHLEDLCIGPHFLLELTFSSLKDEQGIRLGNKSLRLPKDMERGILHEWRIEQNAGLLSVWIDKVLSYRGKSGGTKHVAWLGKAKDYEIENISYCEGWDEWASFFDGWNGLQVDSGGMKLGDVEVLKGEPAKDYSFSALFRNATPTKGIYGVRAAVCEDGSELDVLIDANRQKLVLKKIHSGEKILFEYELDTLQLCYPDIKYSDTFEKQYRFPCTTFLSYLRLPKGKSKDLLFSWLDGNKWQSLPYSLSSSVEEDWEELCFQPLATKALRMQNADPRSNERHIYDILAGSRFAEDCQLRVEKRGGMCHFFVDEREIVSLHLPEFGLTRVGLSSDGKGAVHVANTLYYPIY